MNSGNRKTSKPYRPLLNLADKINLKRSDKYVALSNLTMYYTWKNINCHTKTINLKALTWNEKFELSGRLYSVSDIQNYFEYILKMTRRKDR